MKYALIGCGRVAPNHLNAAMAAGVEISAFCDIDFNNIDILLEKCSVKDKLADVPRFASAKEMLSVIRPDFVSVALPSGLHAEYALMAINAGVSTLIEKPIAMSLEDADKIIAAAEENKVTVGVCHQNRFNEAVQAMRGALENGGFGIVSHGAITVRWSRGKDYYDSADWRGKWASDGGTLMNQCIHGIDLLRWMLGEPEEVCAYTARRHHSYIEAEDIGTAVLKFKSGALATVEGTVNCFERDLEEKLAIFGDRGMCILAGSNANTVEVWDVPSCSSDYTGLHEKAVNVYGNGHISLFADFIEAVKTGRKPYVTAEDGRRALETVLAVYKSAAEGRPVSFPLDSCASSDFEGRFD